MGHYSAASEAELEMRVRQELGEPQSEAPKAQPHEPSPAPRPAQTKPPAPISKSQPETPMRRAFSLPKTAGGDTLLVLPEDRDIPPGLVNERRWVSWKAEWDEGKKKWKKPPRSVRTGKQIGAIAKYLDDFGTFAEARAAAEKFDCSGVGFVLLARDGRVGIDFDHCIRTHENGQFIDPAAWTYLDKWFGETYQEVSPWVTACPPCASGRCPTRRR